MTAAGFWIYDDYDAARKEAQRTDKPMIVAASKVRVLANVMAWGVGRPVAAVGRYRWVCRPIRRLL